MTKAVRIHETGGPEKLIYEDVEVGRPGEGQVRLKQTAIGLNYIDVYHRTGLYPLPFDLPVVIGTEAAGVVEETGAGVDDVKAGDRVAYAPVVGSYAEARLVPANRLIKLPDSIDDKTAAAMLLQGMTVSYLLRRTFPVKKGQTILLYAAAGGVGLILAQWAKHLGVTVIGVVGSDDKAKLAKANGCAHTINYATENVPERVAEITGGAKVPVVYDSVGKDTFMDSLDCLQPLGTMVSFGNASGALPPIDAGLLSAKGSLYFTRPGLMHHVAKREDLLDLAQSLFDVVEGGHVKIHCNQEYALKDIQQVHRDLEARKTTGSTVIIP
ncbi:MAG: quinone oxidoreductase [Rhodospirillaceae bacterium]|jgi:NADPH2:quinone reductase